MNHIFGTRLGRVISRGHRAALVPDRETGYTPYVCGILALLFIAVPAAEIAVLMNVGSALGLVPTVAILILTGITGAALARHQGLAAVRQMQAALARGERVGTSAASAVLVLIAGVLMMTPGFLTDIAGIALLLPPIRNAVAAFVVDRYARKLTSQVVLGSPWPPGFGQGRGPGQRPGPHGYGQGQGGERAAGHPDDYDPPPPGVIDV